MHNKFYNTYRWYNNNEGVRIGLFFFSIVSFCLMPKDTFFFYTGFISITIICFFSFIKININKGNIIFDKSKYNIPIIGDKIQVTKDFPCVTYIGDYLMKGHEYIVYDVVEHLDDWIIFVRYKEKSNHGYRISYIKHKKYFTTKSDIRNKKLEKLLK